MRPGVPTSDYINWDYTGNANANNLVNGAWQNILNGASTLGENATHIEIFDTSGVNIELGYGPDATHVTHMCFVFQGGNAPNMIPALLSKGMTLWAQAVTTSATTGRMLANFYR